MTRINCPLVNRAGESTLPGLYFAGAHTAVSLGPGVRFISGTHATAAQLARLVARRAHKGAGPARLARTTSGRPRAAVGADAVR